MSGQTVEGILAKLLRRGRLQPATAIDRIRSVGQGLTRMAVRDGLAELARANRITGVTIDGQVVGKIGWREMPVDTPDPSLLDWQRRVAASDMPDINRRAALM